MASRITRAFTTAVSLDQGLSPAPDPLLRFRTFLTVLSWADGSREWTQEVAMIRKEKAGYKVISEKGKNLGGPYRTKAEAENVCGR